MQRGPQRRLFWGVPIPAAVRDRAAAVQRKVRPYIERATWVAPENFHLTLKFLGATPEDRLELLQAAGRRLAREHRVFTLELSGCGVFPDWRRPRVLWIGVRHHPALWALAQAVEDAMAELSYARETRAYAPHLTLARIKSVRPAVIAAFRQRVYPELADWSARFAVTEFILFESHLRPQGAVYTPVARFPLRR